jgi:hypothetical protein
MSPPATNEAAKTVSEARFDFFLVSRAANSVPFPFAGEGDADESPRRMRRIITKLPRQTHHPDRI